MLIAHTGIFVPYYFIFYPNLLRSYELVIWQLLSPVSGSDHSFEYRLAFVVDGICVLRYDNEAGKGDHKHKGKEEASYEFITPQLLLNDFWNEVDKWRP